jgi:hypothetical protein
MRGLLPADELQLRLDNARIRGILERKRLRDELRYEEAKTGRFGPKAAEIRAKLTDAQRRLLNDIKREKSKGKEADRERIEELQRELRGLLWGK